MAVKASKCIVLCFNQLLILCVNGLGRVTIISAEDVLCFNQLIVCVKGLGCVTIMSAEGAAMHAAQLFALTDHIVWSKLRAARLNLWVGLRFADRKMQQRLEVDKKL